MVNGILNPADSVYEVEVTWSSPSFGVLPDFEDVFVTNAAVSISNGITTADFTYDENARSYKLVSDDFPLEAETTYLLRVVADDHEVTSSVTTSLPVPEVESFDIRDDLSLVVNWQDTPGTDDYYSVRAFLERQELEFVNQIPYFFDSGFISDGNRDGTILQDVGEGFDRIQGSDLLVINIYRFDQQYVDYFRILENYVGDDPFSEPTQLPTNIEGGLGIFAVVLQSEFKLRAR